MRRSFQVLPRITLVFVLLAFAHLEHGAVAQENPYGLGSPEVTDNPYVDETFIGGGDGGSPWPFARIVPRGAAGGATFSAATPTPGEPSLLPLPGDWGVLVLVRLGPEKSATTLTWIPPPFRSGSPAGAALGTR